MQGHGYAQPVKQPPHTAWLVILRVLLVAVSVGTIGTLAAVTLLRLAAVTRKPLDWCLFAISLVAGIAGFVLVGSEPGEDELHTPGGYLGGSLLLGNLACASVYYLVAEISHFHMRRRAYRAQHGAGAYGYPGPVTPFTATTVQSAPAGPAGFAAPVAPLLPSPPPPAVPSTPHTPLSTPHTPPPMPHTPPPQRPAPARIDQVRAELDELSDYLRKHDDHEGGR
ncbi:hypothetical protein OIB37_16015 [Streptomyces sp. NBC_00820]|uniref:hypothetical protein n=1 Tax=Streptomyces sp. NBC_00820 TaxID=2975842 RepID=UPI002ED113F8|nr:hypothetical protein OIB37_16015 [Streptomyces sp. NBC_00820]